NAKNVEEYFSFLHNQQYKNSRRIIKAFRIQPVAETGQFKVNVEYQWTVINRDNETELAGIGFTMMVTFHQGQLKVTRYHAKYLPPVTDLGAEIRC
ncbi:hypothetical protein, partial [Vibrio sp.]|uniref:hypothetical protein n=1 Tax=Vibrio sp. TaxID=678 RepID=UPI003D0E66CE